MCVIPTDNARTVCIMANKIRKNIMTTLLTFFFG